MDLDFAATAKPFTGVVLCCTGVDHEERTQLVNFAQQMGAVFKADLRSDVTHMVVGNVLTPKYQFAAQHRFDLKVMGLEWIREAYTKWVQGEDVNFQDSINSHILAPLSGLNICLTNVSSRITMHISTVPNGIEEERKVIEQQIRSHGGEYHPDLSRQCTHLLCASSSGKKYEAALKWGIACVGIEWLFQSVERGMALEAKFFTLDIPPEKRGEGAWDRNAALYGHSSLLTTSLSTVPTENENGTRKRRLRRTVSEVAQQGILDGIFNGITETNFQTFEQEPFQETGFIPPISIIEESANEGNSMNLDNSITALFDGMVFYTWGFTDKKREVLSQVISNNGGLIFTKPPRTLYPSKTFTVMPFTIPVEEAPHFGDSEPVTEMWIERCIAINSTFNPSDLLMCKPMPGPFPRPYLDKIAISITGFSGPDLLHIERLITLLGAQYCSNLTRKRSLLLTPDLNVKGQKMTKAKDWGIPVVSVGWLWEVISRGSDEVKIGPWSERPAELKMFTADEGSGSLKLTSGKIASCPPALGQVGSILDGCVIFVSKKLEDQVSDLHSIAKQLGAEIADKFDQTLVTHLIHQSSRNNETFREFRVARSENIHIVHPQWIYECRTRGIRCGEDTWGWMWNADKSLTVIGTAEPNSAPAAPMESRREKRMRQDENVSPHRSVNEPVKIEQIAKLLGNISSPQKKAKRRLAGRARNLQHSNTASSLPSPENGSTKSHEEENEIPRPTQDRVEYKDPVAEREMAKIVANLRGTAEPKGEPQRLVSPEMTPAEDVGTRSSRRKSSRK